LYVEIYDQGGFDYLKRLDTGGTKLSRNNRIAVPVAQNVRIGTHGVVKAQRPKNLTDPFVADLHGKGPALWKRTKGKGKHAKKLKMMYVLKQSVPIKRMVPFLDDFRVSMGNEMRTSFPAAMARAMKSRKV